MRTVAHNKLLQSTSQWPEKPRLPLKKEKADSQKGCRQEVCIVAEVQPSHLVGEEGKVKSHLALPNFGAALCDSEPAGNGRRPGL